MRFAAVLLILAFGLTAARGQAPHHELKDVAVPELKKAYLACNRVAAGGGLSSGAVMQCSLVYEELKLRAFGGDFMELLAWSKAQSPLREPTESTSR
jgi:hypothetical protein